RKNAGMRSRARAGNWFSPATIGRPWERRSAMPTRRGSRRSTKKSHTVASPSDKRFGSALVVFLLFLVSVAVLSAIVRHDDALIRKRRQPPEQRDVPEPDSSSVLALAQALARHGSGAQPGTLTHPLEQEQASASQAARSQVK